MTRNPALTAVWLLLSLAAKAAGAEPTIALAEEDRIEIERNLGPGVLGQPVPADEINDPGQYLRFDPPTRIFQIRTEAGSTEKRTLRWTPAPLHQGHPAWRYQDGEVENGLIRIETDGGIVLTGVEDAQTGTTTRYDPPEPFLLKGMMPGQDRTQRMAVRVFSQSDPGEVLHEGSLDVVYRYLGAYHLVVPAGSFDAVLIKSSFSGSIGPAHVDDTQYRFFALGAGLVASIEMRDVSAFVVYNTHLKESRVLAAD